MTAWIGEANGVATSLRGWLGHPIARVGVTVLTGVILLIAVVVWQARLDGYLTGDALGADYRHFVVYGKRFLETGSIYLPEQLSGPFSWSPEPYDPARMPALYPPLLVYVVVPLVFVPSLAWWVVPLSIIGYALVRWRPAAWSWPILAFALAQSASIVLAGSSTMWVAALVAAGLLWHWPAALIVIKPTFAPLALVGVRHVSWWLAMLVLIALAVLLVDEWARYALVVQNAGAGPLYALGEWPVALAPLIAWLARTR